jgi:riboflavin kinase / FMN adenylyltransferase
VPGSRLARAQLTHPVARRLAHSSVIDGIVEEGDHRGRVLGWPTANVHVGPGEQIDDGVYAGWYLRPDGAAWPAAVSVGRRSTFYGTDDPRLAEAHLIGFSGDLVGEPARLVLVWYLRPQQRFPSTVELAEQIGADVRTSLLLLGAPARPKSSTRHTVGGSR